MKLAIFGLLNVLVVIRNLGTLVMMDFPRFSGHIFQREKAQRGQFFIVDSIPLLSHLNILPPAFIM
jgi:hypothetical protein